MIVPTKDYSPLINAKSQATQAKRSQFVAPGIEYNTKSLKLQEKGLEKTQSHIQQQADFTTISYMYNTAKNMVMTAVSAGVAQQAAASQAMGNSMTQALNTKIGEMVANGDLYVAMADVDTDPTHNTGGKVQAQIVGLDKLQAFQNEQLQQIQDQKWFPSIKKQTISAMQNVYAGSEQKILQDYWAKETQARFQLEQQNLIDARDRDIAQSTLDSPSYSNTMATIANMHRGTKVSDALALSSMREIDFGVAANSVRDAAVQGGSLAGVNLANQISDQRGYNADDRNRLIGYANGAARQAQINAQNAGTQFMEQQIASGTMGKAAWDNVKEQTKALPGEQREAFEQAAERVHMKSLVELNSKALSGLDSMSPDDIRLAIDELDQNKGIYEGTPATVGQYTGLKNAYEKRLKEFGVAEEKINKELSDAEKSAIKEFKSQQDAILDTLIPLWEGGELTGGEVIRNCEAAITDAAKANQESEYYTDEDEAKVLKAGQNIINKVKGKLPPKKKEIFDRHYKDIEQQIMKFWFNEDNKNKLSKEQKNIIYENQKWVEGKMLDLVYDNQVSDDDFEKELEDTINGYEVNLYGTFGKDLIVDTNHTKEEAAMERTQAFQNTKAVYYDNSTGTFSFPPGVTEGYDNAALIERDMIRDNYGIDVKDNYTLKQLDGNIVPVFERKDGGPDVAVYNGEVYNWYSHGNLVPLERTKPFTRDGYEDIPGVSRHFLSDPNLNRPVISSTTKRAYEEETGGR